MIRDLAVSPVMDQSASADVLVIGAGIAGLLVATRLARANRRVVVVESGGFMQIEDSHPLNEVEQLGDVYSGATQGRFRCLGGTSTRWGGAMIPFQASDMVDVEGTSWPISLDTLTAYQADVERLFGLENGPYDFPELMPGRDGHPSSFMPRLAKWPAFRSRNVASLLAREIQSDSGPEIWLNATATDFDLDAAGRLGSVTTRNRNGRSLTVTAKQTVVTAGAIESTRLLLLADRQHGERIFAPDGMLGRHFYDHLSAPTAKLVNVRRKELNRLVGFRFEGASMRNLRFEPDADLRASRMIPAGFVHISFATGKPTGFDALRDVYRKIQRRDRPSLGDAAALALALPWLVRAVWWRFAEKRLLFPTGAELDLHVVIEQEPRPTNRIGLSSRRTDPFGLPLATLDWRVSDDDATNLIATTEAFLDAWNNSSLSRLAVIQMNAPADPRSTLAEGGGIYHPGGTVRMGGRPDQGVVDSEFRTFRVPNLTVVSTATFPRGGGANPTMMLMMAAMHVADRLARLPV